MQSKCFLSNLLRKSTFVWYAGRLYDTLCDHHAQPYYDDFPLWASGIRERYDPWSGSCNSGRFEEHNTFYGREHNLHGYWKLL